jgi:hypothetical protein
MEQKLLIAVGAVATALALGLVPAMTVIVGRMAFKSLPEDAARDFLRAAFPVYYIMLLAFTCIGGATLALPRPVDASILGAVAFTALFAWLWLMPIAHRLDDMQRDGQDMRRELVQVQGRTSFIIVAQMAALITVVIRLAVI